jgi:excisionase family DNA binding protein
MPAAMKSITLENLIRGERFVEELTPQEAAAMLTALAGVQLALANRILTAKPPEPPPKPDDSKMLKVDEVAALLNTPRRTVYDMSRRQDWRAFTVRLSRRHLRFRESGLRKWIAQRANLNSWEAHR